MAVLKFYVLRLTVFLVPFVIYCLVGVGLVFSTVFATATGVCLSYLLLNKQRRQAALSISDRAKGRSTVTRSRHEVDDNSYEDAAVDEAFTRESPA